MSKSVCILFFFASENEVLKHEVDQLKKRHYKQQLVLNKVF